MALRYTLVMMLGACGFAPSTAGVQPDAQPGDPTPDAQTQALACHSSDTSIRLCLDFEDPSLDPTVADLSTFGHDGTAIAVNPMARAGQQAASFVTGSSVHVAETPDLDIGDHLTYELWIDVLDPTAMVWPLDNDGQYALGVSQDHLFCYANGFYADTSVSLGTQSWHHVACTYGAGRLTAYVDGQQAACTMARGMIKNANKNGTNVGANFVGGIDDVHVYARALDGSEIAAIAGVTPNGGVTACD